MVWALGLFGLEPPCSVRALSFEPREAELARELSEGVEAQRLTAAAELVALSPERAWPLLRRALSDPSNDVRALAAESAARLGLVEALSFTRAWLDVPDEVLRIAAVRVEGALGDASSVPALARALGDARHTVRAAAAEALGRLEVVESAAPLGSALSDADVSVRAAAAEALGRVPGSQAQQLLLSHTLDPSAEVRAAVIDGLAARSVEGLDASVDPRRGAVLIVALSDEAPEVRMAAIVALGRTREALAVTALAALFDSALDESAGVPRDATREAVAALAALGRIESDDALDAIVRASAREALRPAAVRALRDQAERDPALVARSLTRFLGGERDLRTGRDRAEDFSWLAELVAEVRAETDASLARALLEALRDGAGPPVSILPALGAATPAGVPLGEEVAVAISSYLGDPVAESAALDGLERMAQRRALDARAVEPLLARVAGSASAEVTRRIVRLLGSLADPRAALRLVDMARERGGVARVEALEALGGLGERGALDAVVESLPDLVRAALGATEPRERLAAAAIARAYAEGPMLRALAQAWRDVGELDRPLIAETLAFALARDEEARAVDPTLRAECEQVVVEALASSDARLVSAAAAALVAWPSAARRWLVAALERLGDPLASGDPLALARLGRSVGADLPERLAAVEAAEAELVVPGSERLLEPEHRFGMAHVRSFALLWAVRRGELGSDVTDALCGLVQRREPAVRANAVLALAHLGSGCPGVDPLAWIERSHHGGLRLAALQWVTASASLRGSVHSPRLTRALDRCREQTTAGPLRSACERAARTPDAPVAETHDDAGGGLIDLTVLDEGGAPLPGRLVEIRFEDGSSVVLRTDGAGRIALRWGPVPEEPRELDVRGPVVWVLEDPFASTLEP